MEPAKVMVLMPVRPEHMEYLAAQVPGRYVFVKRQREHLDPAEVAATDVILGNIRPPQLAAARRLKLLQLSTAGYEAYTVPGVLPATARLCNARGAYSLAVGEHMLALTFALVRHLPQYRDRQTAGVWQNCGPITAVEGATVAVLGLGDIGGFYARKMKALGAARVLGFKRTPIPCPEWLDGVMTLDRLDEVLPEADIVAMVLPDSPATFHLLDERRLRLLKPGAYLINVGRGRTVDQEALIAALRAGRLGGAGLDVTDPEPLPATSALWGLPNVLLTPHVAGNYYLPETLNRIVRIAGANLRALADGSPLKNEIVP